MKLLLIAVACALAFICIQVDATVMQCYITIYRGSLSGYEHIWQKNGDNIAGECFGAYYDSIAHQGYRCNFQSQKIDKSPSYDQAQIYLVTVCPDDGTSSRKVIEELQSRGFFRA